MNDPGLDEPIGETSQNIEKEREEEEDAQNTDEQAFLKPSRWWFASTAFPLLAGTFGPMASAFNICALVVHWRVEIPPGLGANESHGNDVRDPKWLLAINGLSLGFALIANFSLLLNMARRLSFPIAQPITIVGWYISSFLLIGDISGIINYVQRPNRRRALTQAFYYAIFAASLYFIIATLMVVTVFGAWKKHYRKEFKLTTSQRTLMLQTIAFMVYMVGGAGVYAKVEGWMFLDALFFTNFTLLTVGIGDYAPLTHLGRGLLFPYAVGGIVTLGLVIGSIRSLVLERGRNKLGRRMAEKKREALIRKLLKEGKDHLLEPIKTREQAKGSQLTERQRREKEFNLMRNVQQATATRQKWLALLISGGAWLVLWFMGSLVFYLAEHEQRWTYFQSLYFSYTTLLTIGYGDFKPFSNSGKAFFVFWSLLAVPTLTIVISNMGDTVVKIVKDATLYLGEFTLLPGDTSAQDRVKQAVGKISRDKFSRKSEGVHENEPFSFLGKGGGGGSSNPHDHLKKGADTAAGNVEESEIEGEHLDRQQGNILGSSVHEYHFKLAREFRIVIEHLSESPPRSYSYSEWAYYLKLLGEDEESTALHRRPPVKPDGTMQQEADEDEGRNPQKWSWLGEQSPLMGEMEEAEWILEKLARRLEGCLKELHEDERRRGGEEEKEEEEERRW